MTENQSNPPDDGGHDTDVQVDEQSRSHEQAVQDHERSLNRRDFAKAVGTATAATAVGTGGVSAQSTTDDWIDGLVDGADVVIGEAADNIDWKTAGVSLVSGPVGAAYFSGRTAVDVLQELGDNPNVSTVQDAMYNDAILAEKQVVEAVNSTTEEIQQTAGLSRAEGKAVAFKAISNGQSQSTASSKATERIDEYFAGVKEAFYRAQENLILQLESWDQTIQNTSLSYSDVFSVQEDQSYFNHWGWTTTEADKNPFVFYDVTVNINGTDKTFRGCTVKFNFGNTTPTDDAEYLQSYGVLSTDKTYSTEFPEEGMFTYGIQVTPSYQTDDPAKIWDFYPDRNTNTDPVTVAYPLLRDIESARNNAQSDVATIVSDVFSNYSEEQLSEVDEFISPFQRTLLSSEDYTETGAPVYPQMVSNELGIPTSQAGYSLTIEYEPSTGAGTDGNTGTSDDTFGSVQTLNGTLWGFKPANSTELSTGTTYLTRADNSSGNVAYFNEVKDDGSTREVKLDGRFTITSIKNRDGSEASSVGTYDATLQSPDTSNLIDQFKQANDRRNEENETAPAAPGAGDGGGANEALRNLGIVGAIIAVVYGILTRDDD